MDPIQVHATVDVNVKVDRALDDFFGDLDKKSTTITTSVKPLAAMKTLTRLLIVSLMFATPALVTRAEDLGAVRARMEQRLGELDQLKASGAIGENNRGFVELRESGGDAGAVAAAENRDRETVYAAIAAKAGTSADQVGRARARQIAANSAAGVWLQDESGTWYRK
ncbi:MAG: YdbL family protein [Cephaloticoccus sp.]